MMFLIVLSVLAICIVWGTMPTMSELTIQTRRRLCLVVLGTASFVLLLAGSNSAQPMSIDMDLLTPALLESGDVAMSAVELGQSGQQETFLIPLMIRVPMGGLYLWISLIFCMVLMVLPAIRGVEEYSLFAKLHAVPMVLTVGTLAVWCWTVGNGLQTEAFEAYLREFDLGKILNVDYPSENLTTSLATSTSHWLGGLCTLLSILILSPKAACDIDQAKPSSKSSLAAVLLLAILLGLATVEPAHVTSAQSYLLAMVLLLGTVSVIEKQALVRVWSSVGCFMCTVVGWIQL